MTDTIQRTTRHRRNAPQASTAADFMSTASIGEFIQTTAGELLYIGRHGRYDGADYKLIGVPKERPIKTVDLYRVVPESRLESGKISPIRDGQYNSRHDSNRFSECVDAWNDAEARRE